MGNYPEITCAQKEALYLLNRVRNANNDALCKMMKDFNCADRLELFQEIADRVLKAFKEVM